MTEEKDYQDIERLRARVGGAPEERLVEVIVAHARKADRYEENNDGAVARWISHARQECGVAP